jgi:hypothetical protein
LEEHGKLRYFVKSECRSCHKKIFYGGKHEKSDPLFFKNDSLCCPKFCRIIGRSSLNAQHKFRVDLIDRKKIFSGPKKFAPIFLENSTYDFSEFGELIVHMWDSNLVQLEKLV